MQELFQELQEILEAGETAALATIIRRRGSVPREVGAKMLVRRDGRISGTIGGGCGEAEVWRGALNAIDTGRTSVVQVSLTDEITLESQGVCGGTFEILIQPWSPAAPDPDQPTLLALVRATRVALENEQAAALATICAANGFWRSTQGQQMLYYENGKTLGSFTWPGAASDPGAQLAQETRDALRTGSPRIAKITGTTPDTWAEVFIEPCIPPPVLLIAGAGHIAVPLATLASLMKFSVSVTDDRTSFANRERFPTARQVLVGDIEAILRAYPMNERTHVVLVTRAHGHDVQGLRAIIDSPAAYIGMIGSQRRVWAVLKLLHNEGVPTEKLLRIRAPIGLDLAAQTPEEIALAIMAEIVLLRHHGTGRPLSNSLRDRYKARLQRLDLSEEYD